MSKTLTFKRTVNSVDDAGIVVVREETVGFNAETAQFIIGLPKHVAAMAGHGHVIDSLLTEAVAKYEGACDTFSRERLGIKFEPMLMLVSVSAPGGVAKQYGLCELVGLGLKPVAIDTRNDYVYRRHEDGSIGGLVEIPGNIERILLPDTPEIRAQYDSLVTSIRKAGEILSGIDGADYFLKISHGGSAPVPAEPGASASSDSAQPQLPFNETNDDEEL